MEIEIVEFYWDIEPKNKKFRTGTMHIYLIEDQMDFRGITFIQAKKDWVIRTPHKQAMEDGKKVFYPVISFTDPEKMKKLFEELRAKGVKYIEDKIKQENMANQKVEIKRKKSSDIRAFMKH